MRFHACTIRHRGRAPRTVDQDSSSQFVPTRLARIRPGPTDIRHGMIRGWVSGGQGCYRLTRGGTGPSQLSLSLGHAWPVSSFLFLFFFPQKTTWMMSHHLTQNGNAKHNDWCWSCHQLPVQFIKQGPGLWQEGRDTAHASERPFTSSPSRSLACAVSLPSCHSPGPCFMNCTGN